jgi:hypothetical protein
MATPTPTSIRLPVALAGRVRARAYLDRASFSETVRCLLERGLDGAASAGVADQEEIERLAVVAVEALRENGCVTPIGGAANREYPGPPRLRVRGRAGTRTAAASGPLP